MKFLLFNLIVAASIYYLFAGDAGRDSMEVAAGRAIEAAGPAVERAREAIGTAAPRGEMAMAPVSPVLAPVSEAAMVAEPIVTSPELPALAADALAPVSVPVLAVVEGPEINLALQQGVAELADPEVQRRRAEVLGYATAMQPDATVAAQFMTPADRRNELDRLVREMEILFARNLGN